MEATQTNQRYQSKPNPTSESVRTGRRSSRGRRLLGLGMIKQALRDLRDAIHKGRDPEPDPREYIFSSAIESACDLADVAVGRVRREARDIIGDTDNALHERRMVHIEELEDDAHDWLKTREIVDRHSVDRIDTVASWCRRGEIHAVKAIEENGRPKWRVRLDVTLQDKFIDYDG